MMSRRPAAILFLAALLATQCVAAADDASAEAADAEVRDAMLLLDRGPLHLRLRVTLGGRSLSAVRQEYVDRLIRTMDADDDGRITRDEADRSPLLATKRRPGAEAFLRTLGTPQTVDRDKIEQTVARVGGQTVVYRQNDDSSEADTRVFEFLDEDASGVLDADEIRSAAARIVDHDRDGDDCVSFDEFLPEPEPDPNDLAVVGLDEAEDVPTARFATMLRDTSEPLLPRRLVREYDRNRDGRLSPRELHWQASRLEPLDEDGSGDLDVRELAAIERTPVDLEIHVELDPAPGEEALRVRATTGDLADSSKRPDYARVQFARTRLSIAFRNVDPIATSVEQALDLFNRLDVDQNGYLDEEETSGRVRFERGLFDAMDADGDAKVFGEEMEHYVRVRSEPAASSCRVHVFDTGRGFFQALDRNGDGLISIRDRRSAVASLASLDRDGRTGVTPEEPARNFQIEFVRGSYRLFGRTNQVVARTPEFTPFTPVGPVWFSRMDRNRDGDLTWDEFLGSRIDFNRIDADHDALIDPREAEAATPREDQAP